MCIFFYQQIQLPSAMLILVLVSVKSTWTMLAAVVVRVDLLTAQETSLSNVIVAIQRTLECDVKVEDKPHLEIFGK